MTLSRAADDVRSWRFGVMALVLVAAVAACKRDAPVNVAAEIASGDRLIAAGKPAEAAVSFRRAVAHAPLDTTARLKLARALEQNQQWTAAASEAMRAADLAPGHYQAGLLAARLVLLQGRFDDSLALTTRLLSARPGDVDALILWGTANARLAHPVSALVEYGSTGGRGPAYDVGCTDIRPLVSEDGDRAAEDVLRRAVVLSPRSIDARLALLNFLWATRRADEVAELLGTLADELPHHALVNETAGHYFLARGQVDLGERYLANAATAPHPHNRNARLSLAERYISVGRYQDAIAMLDGLPAADDDAGVVTIQRVEALNRLGRFAEAAGLLDALIARSPLHTRAWVLKSRTQLAAGDATSAHMSAERAVKSDPHSADARVELARAYEALDDADLAYREYAEAQRLSPTKPGVAEALAALGLRTGRYRAALAAARQAAERAPDDPEIQLALVEALVRSGRATEAETRLAPFLKASPVRPRVQLLRGLVHAARGRDAAARAELDAALRTAPDSIDAIASLVELDLAHGLLDTARKRVESALAARPGHLALLRLRGHVQRAAGDLTGAEATFREALTARPTDTDAALLLAQCLADRRRPAEAQRILDQVLRRRPSSLAAQTAMAGVFEALGRLDDAQEQYERILAEYPDAIDAASRLAVLLVARGRNASIAQNVLGEALRIAPGDPRVSDAYGWVQLHREQVPAALEFLQAAARQDPENPTYLYHLGVAYSRAGQAALARSVLTQALRLQDAFPDRARAEAELKRLPH